MEARDLLIVLLLAFCAWLGGYAHDLDVIRQCEETGIMKPWSEDRKVTCEIAPVIKDK